MNRPFMLVRKRQRSSTRNRRYSALQSIVVQHLKREHVYDHFKQHWPYYAYAVWISIGIAVYRALDALFDVALDVRATEDSVCMGRFGFMGYVVFVFTATTTIGEFEIDYICVTY